MRKPKIGQRVVFNSPIPEQQLRGQVSFVSAISVGITSKDIDPQKHPEREVLIGGNGTGLQIGVQKGNEKFFSWHEYEKYFIEEEGNETE